MHESVLVVAVHPDDETLGCGGTLLRFRNAGVDIHWMIVTEMTPDCGFSESDILQRESEILKVCARYNFKSVSRLGFPATKVDEISMSILVKKIYDVFCQVQPTQVYLPFKFDAHTDHQHVFSAAFSCTKSFRFPSVKRILMMETLSETDFSDNVNGSFIPNVFVDISNEFDEKLDILKLYETEFGYHPFPRSEFTLKGLAAIRGAAAGCHYAESFMMIKEIVA